MFVRTAVPDDALEVRRIIDAAMLEVGDVESSIDDGAVLVAGDRQGRSGSNGYLRDTSAADAPSSDAASTAEERLLGTAVLVAHDDEPGAHVSAIAVRRRHRNRGIGRGLIDQALEREQRLTARFDADVRPFYDALGFSIERIDDGRYRGNAVTSDSLEQDDCP